MDGFSGPLTAECYTYEEENVDQVLDISPEQLAYLALRAILDRIHAGWDLRKRKGKVRYQALHGERQGRSSAAPLYE